MRAFDYRLTVLVPNWFYLRIQLSVSDGGLPSVSVTNGTLMARCRRRLASWGTSIRGLRAGYGPKSRCGLAGVSSTALGAQGRSPLGTDDLWHRGR